MSLHLVLAVSVIIGLLWLIASAGWEDDSRLWKSEGTPYGRLYLVAAIAGIGTVLLMWLFAEPMMDIYLAHIRPLFGGGQGIGDDRFGAIMDVPLIAGLGLSLFPPLAVGMAGGMLGAARRRRVAGMMAFNQFLMFVPVSFTPLPIIAVIMLALTGIHPLVLLFGIPALLSMASLWLALTETKEANKRETPAPERAVEERPGDSG